MTIGVKRMVGQVGVSLLAGVFLSGPGSAQARVFEEPVVPAPAIAAPSITDPAKVAPRQYWTELALKGNARAQFTLGQMYEFGDHAPHDEAEATRWYRLAADQGYADAELRLALRYANGRGVAQDSGEAVKWLTAAAQRSHPIAQNTLGLVYDRGLLATRDEVTAARES